MKYSIANVDKFRKDLTKLAKKYPSSLDMVEYLFCEIENGNLIGEDIAGLKLQGNKVFKARMANPDANKGKSGGFRVIYYLVTSDKEVYPLTIYSKNDQDDISNHEIMRIIRTYLEF